MNYEKGYISLLNAILFAIYILERRQDMNEAITILDKVLFESIPFS